MTGEGGGLHVLHRGRDFRLLEYRCDGHPEDAPLEITRFAEVVLVQAGAFVRQDAETRSFMDETTIGVFPAGGSYRISHFGPRPDVCTIIALDDAHPAHDLVQSAQPLLLRADAECHALHCRLLRASRAATDTVGELVDLLLLSVHGLVESGQKIDIAAPEWRFADDVLFIILDHIHQHHDRPVRLGDIAHRAGYSPFHLSRHFKVRMGCTIQQYVAHLRLVGAARLLAGKPVSMTDIALHQGFGTAAHFSDRFRRWAGVPPSEWRRALIGI